MLRANYAMLILLPALFVGYAACTGEDASEENTGAEEAQLTTAPTMVGTFRARETHYGVALLTLKTDRTFHLEEGLECICAPCDRPEVNGLYRLTTLNGMPVIALMATGHLTEPPEYLKYMLRGEDLYVAPPSRYAVWQLLRRSDQAWCEVRSDCSLQDLQPGPCAGGWYCASNVCGYSCGPVTCEMDNSCPDR